MTEVLSDDQTEQLLENTYGKAVRLTDQQWAELIGVTTQGAQLMLSQLALQQTGLSDVTQLSTKVSSILDEIKRQLQG